MTTRPTDIVKAAHGRLWARIEAEGIILRAHIRLGSLDAETQGDFFINLLGEPQIHVYRAHRADTVDDYEQELITLAHEYGHAISHQKGQRPREQMPQLSAELARRISRRSRMRRRGLGPTDTRCSPRWESLISRRSRGGRRRPTRST